MGRAVVWGLLGAVLVACWSGGEASAGGRASGVWRQDYEAAFAEARRENKPLLLHFSASWCGPCRQMEANVLYQPDVLKRLDQAVIPVMIDYDENPKLVEQFSVRLLPTDIYVDPNGRVVGRDTGNRSLGVYVSRLNSVASRVAGEFASAKPERREPKQEVAERPKQPAVEPRVVEKPAAVVIGLDGYSPVALSTSRKWIRGREEFALEYKGVIYRMSSADELARFRASPEKYAPKLLGCDPVVLWNSDRALSGSTQHGAFFDGALYLFVSRESREQFKKEPLRYTRSRHVLRIDQVDGAVLR